MNEQTEKVLDFISGCYNNNSVCYDSPERKVLSCMNYDTNNLSLGERLNTDVYGGTAKTIQDLTDAVAHSMEYGWNELVDEAQSLIQGGDVSEGDCWFEHYAFISSAEGNIEWRELAEALWGDEIRKYIHQNHMKQVILVGRHTSDVDYTEHGFNVVEQRNINWATESDEAVIAQWDELCSEAWDKKLGILLQNIPAPLAIALVRDEWNVDIYITIQVMGDRPADIKKSFQMTAYDIPKAIEACKHANGRARFEWDDKSDEFAVIVDPIMPFKLQRIAQLF